MALGCKDKSGLRGTGVVLCVWCSVYGALCIWNGARMPVVTYPGSG